MSVSAIRLEGLGKRYARVRSGQRPDSLREALTQAAASMLKRARTGSSERLESFWALKDLSFSIPQGEILGVIGSNGAGKSTLLKILSRITKPSEGWAEVRGRVGSLLEVGTGFNWELTGRENVFLNGAILGMRASEVRRKFDEIVAFAEVEPFIDTPVKRYSSGMYMRLAFAVAAHLEPDILIVDEVLAVGDAAFQRKCLGKMGAESMKGRTVLFVSHNMVAIEALSHRVIWLGSGQVIADGPPKQVVSAYLGMGRGEAPERTWPVPDRPGVYLARASLRSTDARGGAPRITDPLHLEFDVRTTDRGSNAGLALHLFNEQDVLVLATSPSPAVARRSSGDLTRFRCTIPANLLNDGLYRIEAIVRADAETQSIIPECLLFRVHDAPDRREGWYGDWQGVVRPSIEWSVEGVD